DNPVTGGQDLIATVTTAADGRYLLAGLPDGSYTVVVDALTLPAGVAPTFDRDGTATPNSSTATLDATTPDDLTHDFSYAGLGSIGDLVWDDLDGDGIVDLGEPALGGVPVTLTYTDPVTGVTFTETETTGTDGRYSFDHLPAGGYEIEIDVSALPDGYAPTYDVDTTITPDRVSLPLDPADDRVDVDFGYRLEADLGIVKSHDGDFAIGGENRWTVAITNDGPAAAAAPVEVFDTLPAGVTYVEAESDAWRCTATDQRVTCTYVGPGGSAAVALPPSSETTIELVVSVAATAAPAVSNSASVSSPTPDPDPTDDSSSDTAAVPLAVVALDKSLSSNELVVGQEAAYELFITNYGPSVTRGDMQITDELPPGLRFVSADPGPDSGATCAASGSTVTCATASVLDVGETWSLSVVVDVTADTGSTVINDAAISGGNQVNGVALSPSVLDSIYDQLADPASGLGPILGIGAVGPATTDQVPATVTSLILAFTGTTTGYLLTAGPLLALAGGVLILVARARRLQATNRWARIRR
ncbi:MAG: hypothetical protein OEV40_20355, partial [Acidimicrobiia bacterium]|nr:hypothetical protein [Acidimicrobiia bacterium]